MHPVFHVSLLKRPSGKEKINPELPPLPKERERIEEPEAILDRRVIHNQGASLIQVLVKWQDKEKGSSSWEYLPSLLQRFSRVDSLLSIS